MSGLRDDRAGRAANLRLAFDRSFAEAPAPDAASLTEFLAIRVGAAHCALRLSDIRSVFADRKVARVPARHPALLGIASFRGSIVPAYGLHILLGHPAEAGPRWLAIAAAAPVAFAFDELIGYLRVAADAFVPQGAGETAQQHIREYVLEGDVLRGVIDLPSLVAALTEHAHRTRLGRE